ncbi:MAG: GNAT family N-acetyltransferase [Flavobacteriaceae bacterium]|nr:GNAT family N-acetyltransferase [Bacteroidia bacterium]NNF74168.1 GNAT family N-acetyltransferase [Flavobacteriaceae bacterium]NNK73122.1 GNAT family N-acetyltransferase [Flavobacteriaceae bacterium]
MIAFNTLENKRVKLSLLDLTHMQELIGIAKEPELLQYSPQRIASEEFLRDYISTAIDEFYQGISIPLIIYDKSKGKYAGSTRFGKIDQNNKVLNIGWTWIGRQFQGTGLNVNMKYLMLKYAFEELKFYKVEFRIDERNQRSRRAIEKIGAQLEGILRRNIVMSDGYRRNSCCYGIVEDEWSLIKLKLESLIH